MQSCRSSTVDPVRILVEGDIHQNLQVCACGMYHRRLQQMNTASQRPCGLLHFYIPNWALLRWTMAYARSLIVRPMLLIVEKKNSF
jgi:hypothetical protein